MSYKMILALQAVPQVKDGDSFEVIDKAIEVIENSGLRHQVGPCETVFEGSWEELTNLLNSVRKTCLDAGSEYLLLNIKIECTNQSDFTLDHAMGKHKSKIVRD